jgi:hypothetical protein
MLGRCRVRIIGYHTEDVMELPTSSLPWAVPSMPLTSASISGVGETPAFVEGSTVLGFFSDGNDEQVPVIMGTIPGKPLNKNTDPFKGFSDPNGIYPKYGAGTGYNDLKESDLSRLARNEDAETHASLINKREARQEAIPRAAAPHVESVSADIPGAVYDRDTWYEPHARFGYIAFGVWGDNYGDKSVYETVFEEFAGKSENKGATPEELRKKFEIEFNIEDYTKYNAPNAAPTFTKGTTSVYPFNKVVETESGHVFEVDDTPNNGRIHEYHNSGTFYEVQADGSKITKIMGDEYEITVKDKKVYIKGSCDVTIAGDARMLVQGDKYEEIGGNLFTTVAGNRVTKIIGNDLTEVLSGQSTNVSRDSSFRAGGDQTDTIIGKKTETVAGSKYSTVGGSITSVSVGSTNHQAILGYKVTSWSGSVSMNAPLGKFKALSLNMSLSAALNQTVTAATQLIEGSVMQTLSGVVAQSIVAPAQTIMGVATQLLITPAQTINAPIRTITGVTTHAGVYNITGALNVTGLVTSGSIVSGAISGIAITQGLINLGTHTHPTAPTGPVSKPIPSVP